MTLAPLHLQFDVGGCIYDTLWPHHVRGRESRG
ncbi:hypothetical protein BH18ACT7_BH18ACT7_17550 [soil metagenome]